MKQVPTLKTSRLILRAIRHDDWPDYAALMTSSRAQYMGGPHTTASAWGWFCSDQAQWDWFGFGGLMIDERSTGKCVGKVVINGGPMFPETELGWFVYQEAEGKGIAYEAANAFRNWARTTRSISTLVSYIDRENVRSITLAERLGATLDTQAQPSKPSALVYRHY